MKAVVHHRYGPPEVLRIQDLPRPEPGPGELLVRVNAVAVSSADSKLRSMKGIPPVLWLPARLMFGLFRPRQPRSGAEFAGVVEAVGDGVTGFTPGDRVLGTTAMRRAAHAEYLCIAADAAVTHTPDSLTDADAAALPFGGLAALHFLRVGGIEDRPGMRVLIVGAGGAVGSAAVQLARDFGARVTGVCSGDKVELVESLGAEAVIDYTRQDFAEAGGRYDLIFDTVDGSTWAQAKRVLEPGGRYVNAGYGLRKLLGMLKTSLFGDQKLICTVSGEKREDLVYLVERVKAGALRPVIDRRLAFDQIIEAHRRVDAGHKAGAVVLTMSDIA